MKHSRNTIFVVIATKMTTLERMHFEVRWDVKETRVDIYYQQIYRELRNGVDKVFTYRGPTKMSNILG